MYVWKMPLVSIEIGRFGHVRSGVPHKSSEHNVDFDIGAGVWLEVGEVWVLLRVLMNGQDRLYGVMRCD